MALFTYFCKACKKEWRKILAKDTKQRCPNCGKNGSRQPKSVTTSSKEIVDTGIMPKRVEMLVGAQEISKERSRMDAEENKEQYRVLKTRK